MRLHVGHAYPSDLAALVLQRWSDAILSRRTGDGHLGNLTRRLQHVRGRPERSRLPTESGDCIEVLGGAFVFRVGLHLVSGEVVGGSICATDDPDLYDVDIVLRTRYGDYLEFTGVLDHTPLNRKPPGLPKVSGVLVELDN